MASIEALDVLTTNEVATWLRYSDDQVRRMCEDGRFDGAYRASVGAHWRIPKIAVERFLESARPKVRKHA